MSKYIPDNQKHLTLEDCKHIEKSLNAGFSFKDIARYFCIESIIDTTKAVLAIHMASVSTDIIVKSQYMWQGHSLWYKMYHLSNL